MAKWDSAWNRTFSANYINGKKIRALTFLRVNLHCLCLKNHSSIFVFSFSQFSEVTLRCLSRSKIFLASFFSDKNCSFWCFHVSSENNTNWLPLQENIPLEGNKWWLLCLYITFMFVSYISTVNEFCSFFMREGMVPAWLFYSLLFVVDN